MSKIQNALPVFFRTFRKQHITQKSKNPSQKIPTLGKMRLFIEFLNNFSAVDLLHMFVDGAFRSSDEIKMADYTINYKIIFNDEQIEEEDLKIYRHLQRVVDAVRAHQKCAPSKPNMEEIFRSFSVAEIHFNYFIKYGENEREVKQLNIIERRIIFAFKRKDENVTIFQWLKDALSELLNYVLREFDDTDRVGIVIKHEQQRDRKATFPIRLKTHLESAIILDTLHSILRLNRSITSEERMTLQVVRIRLPPIYRQLNQEHLTTVDDIDFFNF